MDTSMVSPARARKRFRLGLVTPTAGWAAGYVQANLVAVPKRDVGDVLRFAHRNSRACPILEVVFPGRTPRMAPDADLRRDLPAYRVWRNGEPVEERSDVAECWTDDLVAVLTGCSFTFDAVLAVAGIPLRHVAQDRNVPMYRSGTPCLPFGRLRGPLVVSMRPIPAELVEPAVQITDTITEAHGAPVYFGNAAELGIADLNRPDFGDPVDPEPGDVPVFWACGVTLQVAIATAGLPFAITHAPGHMFVSDIPIGHPRPRWVVKKS